MNREAFENYVSVDTNVITSEKILQDIVDETYSKEMGEENDGSNDDNDK